MDLIMSLDEFNPYKTNVAMQRLIMGKHLFPFLHKNIKKYKVSKHFSDLNCQI